MFSVWQSAKWSKIGEWPTWKVSKNSISDSANSVHIFEHFSSSAERMRQRICVSVASQTRTSKKSLIVSFATSISICWSENYTKKTNVKCPAELPNDHWNYSDFCNCNKSNKFHPTIEATKVWTENSFFRRFAVLLFSFLRLPTQFAAAAKEKTMQKRKENVETFASLSRNAFTPIKVIPLELNIVLHGQTSSLFGACLDDCTFLRFASVPSNRNNSSTCHRRPIEDIVRRFCFT